MLPCQAPPLRFYQTGAKLKAASFSEKILLDCRFLSFFFLKLLQSYKKVTQAIRNQIYIFSYLYLNKE